MFLYKKNNDKKKFEEYSEMRANERVVWALCSLSCEGWLMDACDLPTEMQIQACLRTTRALVKKQEAHKLSQRWFL